MWFARNLFSCLNLDISSDLTTINICFITNIEHYLFTNIANYIIYIMYIYIYMCVCVCVCVCVCARARVCV